MAALKSNLVNLCVLALLPIYIGVHLFVLPYPIGYAAVSDTGFISVMTLTIEGCVFVTLMTILFNPQLIVDKRAVIAFAYIIALYFFREADFHRLFTEINVTRGAYFALPNVPLWQKFLIALMYVFLIGSFYYLLRNYARLVWQKIRAFEPWAVCIFIWFWLILMSQLSDRLGFNRVHYARVSEEISECWAALFILLATIQIIPSLKADRSRDH